MDSSYSMDDRCSTSISEKIYICTLLTPYLLKFGGTQGGTPPWWILHMQYKILIMYNVTHYVYEDWALSEVIWQWVSSETTVSREAPLVGLPVCIKLSKDFQEKKMDGQEYRFGAFIHCILFIFFNIFSWKSVFIDRKVHIAKIYFHLWYCSDLGIFNV